MTPQLNRRSFLRNTGMAAAAFAVTRPWLNSAARTISPNEKLNVAAIGLGVGASNVRNSSDENIVALCDLDLSRCGGTIKQQPKAALYTDFRKMLDEQKDIDAVIIATPDHSHAYIAMECMRRGKHVYVQKPISHSVFEARVLTESAHKYKVVTQMGNQGHSGEGIRQVTEWIAAGLIGKVREVHTWTNRPIWPQSLEMDRPTDVQNAPQGMDWNQWCGPAPLRPFHASYHPGKWRAWWDFGTGSLGDMGCHILDPVFSSVAFTYPNSVICLQGGTGPDSWGLDNQVRYTFPGTKFTADTVTLNWFDGSLRPGKEVQALLGDRKITDQGSIYIGTTGVLYSPYIGAPVLFPTEKGKDIPIVKIPGDNHYLQWVEACRGNGAASAPFSYSGPMTESVLLGTMSTRFPKQELTWNAEKMEITNFKDANQFVRKTYRKGYEVEGL